MARIYTIGTEDIAKAILNESKRAQKAVPNMLNAGADVLVKAEKKSIKRFFSTKKGGKNRRYTGDLERSISKGKPHFEKGRMIIDVYPKGKNRRGQRTAEYGSILEYGRGNMDAYPWYTHARKSADADIQKAMKEEWENAD